jgi:predicted nucleic acid-binding protein
MIVVCDASPLIFLAKLNRLDLILPLLGPDVVVLQCVAAEVAEPEKAGEIELRRLNAFLKSVRVVDFSESAYPSSRLSASDRQTLTYAVQQRARWLLADERLMRRIATEEGLATIGTLGLLAAAAKNGLVTAKEALADIDSAVSRHGFRISVALYQRFRAEVGG